MFSPKSVWSGRSGTQHGSIQKTRNILASGSAPKSNGLSSSKSRDGSVSKSKAVSFADRATPNGAVSVDDAAETNSSLQQELYAYQYQMGVLLIEKNELESSHQKIQQSLTEVNDALRKERNAHLVAISEAEKREENLKRALGVEKQCVADLEKAVSEIRSENAEIKFSSDSKLAEANALIASIDEKSLEVESKIHAVDVKLAEVSRRTSDTERKLKDLDCREKDLRRERSSFMMEKQIHDASLTKQREELQDWERKLQEREDLVLQSQQVLNQREERANEREKLLKMKEKDLGEQHKKIDEVKAELSRKEDDVTQRLTSLSLKEKELHATQTRLGQKEEELHTFEEKLTEREQFEIQKIREEHNLILKAKQHKLESEAEEKKRSIEEALNEKLIEVEKKEAEIKHLEDKLVKREQALDTKQEKIKEKESEIDTKSKTVKEKEKEMKSEVKKLETEKKNLQAEMEKFQKTAHELEELKAVNEERLAKIAAEQEQLRITESERSDLSRLQSELKREIEKCRVREEALLKEADDLRQQKESFEKEWEELDEKKGEIERELKSVCEEKKSLEKHRLAEEERIKNERLANEEYISRELKVLELERQSLNAEVKHEKSSLSENVDNERNCMIHEIEMWKSRLEMDLQKKQEEVEKTLKEKEKSFMEEKERELKNICFMKEMAEREKEYLATRKCQLDGERQEIEENKNHLRVQQMEMRSDIGKLDDLSRKLKEHRVRFIEEKKRFVSFIDKHKNCRDCQEITSEFVLSDLVLSKEIENANVDVLSLDLLAKNKRNSDLNLLSSAKDNGNASTAVIRSSPITWLRKCTTKILSISPGRKAGSSRNSSGGGNPYRGAEEIDDTENGQDVSLAVQNRELSDGSIKESDSEHDQALGVHKETGVLMDSRPPDLQDGGRKGKHSILRTRSVKDVVKDAKAILGKVPNTNEESSSQFQTESRSESSFADRVVQKYGRKRNYTRASRSITNDVAADASEENSENTVVGKPRKRQRNTVTIDIPRETRYNLRRPKFGVAITTSKGPGISNNEEEQGDGAVSKRVGPTRVTRRKATQNGRRRGKQSALERCNKVDPVPAVGGMGRVTKTPPAPTEEMDRTDDEISTRENEDEWSQSRGNDEDVETEDDSDGSGGEEGDEPEPGEASIGKKLWTFLTT